MHHRQISILTVQQTKKKLRSRLRRCIETYVRTTHMLSSHTHHTNRRLVNISHYTTVKELRTVDSDACTHTHVPTTHIWSFFIIRTAEIIFVRYDYLTLSTTDRFYSHYIPPTYYCLRTAGMLFYVPQAYSYLRTIDMLIPTHIMSCTTYLTY